MIKVLIGEGHHLLREGMRHVLLACADLRVAAECRDATEVRACLDRERYDVLLLGALLLPIVWEVQHAPPAVVLGDACEGAAVRELLQAGAAGYLCRDCTPEELRHALRAVHRGERYVCGAPLEDTSAEVRQLSSRERQVLLRLAMGAGAHAISRDLALSPSTVRTYRQRIFEKLALADDTALVRYAVRCGLVS